MSTCRHTPVSNLSELQMSRPQRVQMPRLSVQYSLTRLLTPAEFALGRAVFDVLAMYVGYMHVLPHSSPNYISGASISLGTATDSYAARLEPRNVRGLDSDSVSSPSRGAIFSTAFLCAMRDALGDVLVMHTNDEAAAAAALEPGVRMYKEGNWMQYSTLALHAPLHKASVARLMRGFLAYELTTRAPVMMRSNAKARSPTRAGGRSPLPSRLQVKVKVKARAKSHVGAKTNAALRADESNKSRGIGAWRVAPWTFHVQLDLFFVPTVDRISPPTLAQLRENVSVHIAQLPDYFGNGGAINMHLIAPLSLRFDLDASKWRDVGTPEEAVRDLMNDSLEDTMYEGAPGGLFILALPNGNEWGVIDYRRRGHIHVTLD